MAADRVGHSEMSRKIQYYLGKQSKRQSELFASISSNKRILKPSDDAFGTAQSVKLHEKVRRNESYDKVIGNANTHVNISVAALDDAMAAVNRLNELAISATDGGKSSADRASMAEEVEQLLQHLIQAGNTTFNGKYIFAGGNTRDAAFSYTTDSNTGKISKVYYDGDAQVRRVKTSDAKTLEVSSLGSNAGDPNATGTFIDSNLGINTFQTFIDLRDKLTNNDTLGISGAGGIISKIEAIHSNITKSQVRLGGTQELLSLDKTRVSEENSKVQEYLSEIEDADVTKLVLELNNLQNIYEASLSVGGRIMQDSLVRYI